MKPDCYRCFYTDCQFYGTSHDYDCGYFFPTYAYWEKGDNNLIWYCDFCGHQMIGDELPNICPNCKQYIVKRGN